MKKYSLKQYLVEFHEDEYALRVLYYHLKLAIKANDFRLMGLGAIAFGKKYLETPVQLFIDKNNQSTLDAFGVLLSVRGMMLSPDLWEVLSEDGLLFRPKPASKYEWLTEAGYFASMIADPEFMNIFKTMLHLLANPTLNDEDRETFLAGIEQPEYRHLIDFYREEAERTDVPFTDSVVCNNAFVGDEDLVEFDLPETIRYIGDTAFSYCKNLQVIRFFTPDVQFGEFPIVECDCLELIVVPDGSEDYYIEQLPHYEDIIIAASEEDGYWGEEEDFDASKIEEVFTHVTTSYKFFWFLAILEIYHEKQDLTIDFSDILVRMCANAWPIVMGKGMSLGKTDQFQCYFSQFIDILPVRETSRKATIEKHMIDQYEDVLVIIDPLLNNVPYRFLSPWIRFVSNSDVIEKSNNPTYGTPYAIDESEILLDKSWADYFEDNYEQLVEFVYEKLDAYLERNNSARKMREYRK